MDAKGFFFFFSFDDIYGIQKKNRAIYSLSYRSSNFKRWAIY